MTKNLQKFIEEEKKEFCKNNILSKGCEGVLDDLENTIIKAHNLAIDECLGEIDRDSFIGGFVTFSTGGKRLEECVSSTKKRKCIILSRAKQNIKKLKVKQAGLKRN